MIDDILPLNIVQTALSLTKLDRFTLTGAAEQTDEMILFFAAKNHNPDVLFSFSLSDSN